MLNIKANFDEAERVLSDLARKQLPYATSLALNETAGHVKEAEERTIEQIFDRPTPYTKRALYFRRARKTNLTATIGVKSVQAQYLKLQVKGGRRTPKRKALVVPTGARLNKYGNLPKGALSRLKRRKGVFATSASGGQRGHLPGGIYQRTGRKGRGPLKMLVSFEPRASYRKKYNFGPIAMRVARKRFEAAFVNGVRKALSTAR
ncbi:hypothetical protein [Parasedimentitalea huanghaiensis]|uniref:Phage protein, HK97 gp10 family n=1 Tax=Parasedimentitalea huanghaiensis TaxID=2682100 RepID=A0A6L6WBA1_9RHOB|nr:hypothetical protein [Zongyanglinia huanghaiensis]MVO14820.1 hypothetical protein [Zongyanglinia huanghaiensis]